MLEKITDTSEVVQLMKKGLLDGSIKIDSAPKSVWTTHGKFQEYKLDTFRSRFNSVKKGLQDEGKIPKGDNDMFNRTTENDSRAKKARTNQTEDSDLDDDYQPTHSVGQMFHPMNIESVWTDPDSTNQCLSVAILLPSGVVPRDVLSLCVLPGGKELEITIIWPNPFYKMSMLQKKWLGFDGSLLKYHPNFVGFELFLKSFRKRVHDPIECVGRIPLQIPVQSYIFNRTHLGWKDSDARVFYVDLKAPENSYGALKSDDDHVELL